MRVLAKAFVNGPFDFMELLWKHGRDGGYFGQEIIHRLDCKREKTIQLGTDIVCSEVTDWQLSLGSTVTGGRCPQCEQERLYPGMRFTTSDCLVLPRALTRPGP